MLKTPKYDLIEYPEVYEPSEDTFLFLDALELEIDFLKKLKPGFVVEIGSGSGIVITALASILNCVCFATDINLEACKVTKKTAELNNVQIESVNMNLLSGFRNNFDIVLFNPPYVSTDSSEVTGCGLNRAWAGGLNGRQITDKILFNLDKILTDKGVCYMVLLKQNKIEEIQCLMYKTKFQCDIVLERKIPGEHLYIMKFSKLV